MKKRDTPCAGPPGFAVEDVSERLAVDHDAEAPSCPGPIRGVKMNHRLGSRGNLGFPPLRRPTAIVRLDLGIFVEFPLGEEPEGGALR